MSAFRLTWPGKRCGLAFFALLLLTTPASAQAFGAGDAADLVPPIVFEKSVPENISDLQAIQVHVKKVLERTLPATVGIRLGQSQGSGVIISKDGFVLTAGHVSNTPGKDCQVILPDGRKLKGKTLGWNKSIDAGLVKIHDEGDFPFCEMGASTALKKGQWCLAIGHPGGWQKGRSPVVRLGRIQENNKTFLRSDCTLVGGDSGGPLFDMTGKVIGIHSRIGLPITANIHVPVDTYRETWDRLAAAEEWGASLVGGKGGKNQDAYMGLNFDPNSNACKISEVKPDSPAEKAGLRLDDVITTIDGQKIANRDDLSKVLAKFRPSNEVEIIVLRGDETVNLRLVFGKRPN